MSDRLALVWFREDLRLSDNPALSLALQENAAIIPVFIHDDSGTHTRPLGGASRWWLHHSLESLHESLATKTSRLILRCGDPQKVLSQLIKETGAGAVYWNRVYEPGGIERDKVIKKELRDQGLTVRSTNGALLREPHTVANKSGTPFKVFTPFWKHLSTLDIEKPQPDPPKTFPGPSNWPESETLADWKLLPKIPWDKQFPERWKPGEKNASAALTQFLRHSVTSYQKDRNFPALHGTSRLSPHLHFGEISPRQIWWKGQASQNSGHPSLRTFLSEVGWREFAYHLLYHFPHTTKEPLQEKFRDFPWRQSRTDRRAWEKGETGYPIVDAGMRELWATGWMHNRVRMIAGSFLVKNLLLPWQEGEAWFWDTLVDADAASNTLGWQWVGGCGADAAPYFRIFNPIRQGERFDPDGEYVRRWIPALGKMPNKYIHAPWECPAELLASAGVELGKDYPKPMVDHRETRQRALDAFGQTKE
ncbi:MAG: deoxyribodipyrimidine photo-lyase [Opitutales bacterium]|nr:deoxyribodipyrimidine photo-lyase [Opitutales bacterium]MCH8540248.1 DNA photolyase family protein [Opitutales bacterium]